MKLIRAPYFGCEESSRVHLHSVTASERNGVSGCVNCDYNPGYNPYLLFLQQERLSSKLFLITIHIEHSVFTSRALFGWSSILYTTEGTICVCSMYHAIPVSYPGRWSYYIISIIAFSKIVYFTIIIEIRRLRNLECTPMYTSCKW